MRKEVNFTAVDYAEQFTKVEEKLDRIEECQLPLHVGYK
jgi:hypothetical protein